MIAAITVTGSDRSGIIAAVAEAIYRRGGNLEDASMTILEDELAMILLVDFKSDRSLGGFEVDARRLERRLRVVITVRKITRRLKRGEKHIPGTIPYIVSVFGRDQTGIVFQVTRLLASYGLNITGLNSRIVGRGRKTIYGLIIEVDVKTQIANQLRKKLTKLGKKLKVEVCVRQADIPRI